jgi:predicted CXXCH cytochrome family protein
MMKKLSILFATNKNRNRHVSLLTPPPLPPVSSMGGIFLFIFSAAVIAFSLCFSVAPSEARVKGKCKDCHTMHNSYEGKAMTYGNQTGPFLVLTKGGCVGCHGQNPDGAANIITLGKTRIPQIIHRRDKGDLASGNYSYVADGYSPDYTKGHNVKGISMQEKHPMDKPPGFLAGVVIPEGEGPAYWPAQNQLDCSGTWGCHGNRKEENSYKALYGAHHTDDSALDGTSVGKSYRFLSGITGTEHDDWEYLASPDRHNGYKGDPGHNSLNTISYLCGQCHARFHPNANLGGSKEVGHAYNSAWRKHPADIAFSTVHGGYAGSEYQEYVLYNLIAPVAYLEPQGTEKAVDANSIVMCLSCHRAHSSPFPDILRWEYNNNASTIGNTGFGCIVCHTRKKQ